MSQCWELQWRPAADSLYKGPGIAEFRLPGSAWPWCTAQCCCCAEAARVNMQRETWPCSTDTLLRRQAHHGLGLGVYLLGWEWCHWYCWWIHQNEYSWENTCWVYTCLCLCVWVCTCHGNQKITCYIISSSLSLFGSLGLNSCHKALMTNAFIYWAALPAQFWYFFISLLHINFDI